MNYLEFKLTDGEWTGLVACPEEAEEDFVWMPVNAVNVPVDVLLIAWESLVDELSKKEVELLNLKELYSGKEFDIVFKSDLDFKALYGSTSEKVRKQHAKDELSELGDKISDLELSISWIRDYIPLLRAVIRVKQ